MDHIYRIGDIVIVDCQGGSFRGQITRLTDEGLPTYRVKFDGDGEEMPYDYVAEEIELIEAIHDYVI